MADVVRLTGDWVLWPDFAVTSAGFPVSGLAAFGPGDESARLRAVARDPGFCEAVTWQNPAALANAVVKVAEGSSSKPSRARQREEIVASYWQRYCGKNDTIGFFGPLAWGRVSDDDVPMRVRSGALVRERSVHFEGWPLQALAQSLDPQLAVAAGPWPERDLRALLAAHPDAAVRERGLAALGRLEDGRDAVAAASPESLLSALRDLDATFVELTGLEPTRNAGRAYGGRTLCYLDCTRELDVELGAPLLTELAPALQTLFEAGRWYCGHVQEVGRQVIERALPRDGRGPFMPVLVDVIRTLMALPSELADVVSELQLRLAPLLADPDPTTIGIRAAAAFADHRPGWSFAAFQSIDLQLAARDADAIAVGDYLAILGDMHLGSNPLVQGVFAHRHPDPQRFLTDVVATVGRGTPLLLPPWAPGLSGDTRGMPATSDEFVHIAALPETRAQNGSRTWLPHELEVDGRDLVDRTGALRVPLLDVFWLPIFVAGVRSFHLLHEDDEHAPRLTIGRTVLRRETWNIPAAAIPERAEDLAAFGRERGMPRRVFAKSPLERKPMYVDLESRVLSSILCRQARQAAAEHGGHAVQFTEMLPTPEQCWLSDPRGDRYAAEFRLVAADSSRD
jgi:hypothetical protein